MLYLYSWFSIRHVGESTDREKWEGCTEKTEKRKEEANEADRKS